MLFGLFSKKPRIKTSPEEPELVSRMVKSFLTPQLEMMGKTPDDLFTTNYVRGYLMGTLDAITQRRSVPDDESTLVIGAAFSLLFPNQPREFRACLDLADDADFNRGMAAGGAATFALMNGNTRDGFVLSTVWPSGPAPWPQPDRPSHVR